MRKLDLILLRVSRLHSGICRRRIQAQNEPYKLQLLDSIPRDSPITIYRIGEQWWDLCAGPHVASTGALCDAAIEIHSAAAVYWRGDEKNLPVLQVSTV